MDPVEEEPAAQPSAPAGRRLAAAGLGVVALFAALVAVARPTDVATPPSTSPPESEVRLPVAIPDATEPRPASPGLASSPDWEALDAGLLQPGITPWEPVWTGDEIVFQRVRGELIAYRPATDTWRELAPPPIPIEGGGTSALWADDELIMWTDGAAAAWDPHTDDWRVLFRRLLEPSPTRRIVWTGDEVVDIDAALAVDPVDGSARGIASAPSLGGAGHGGLGGRSHRGHPAWWGVRPGDRCLVGCSTERTHPAGCRRGVDRVGAVRRRLSHGGPRLRHRSTTPGPRTRTCRCGSPSAPRRSTCSVGEPRGGALLRDCAVGPDRVPLAADRPARPLRRRRGVHRRRAVCGHRLRHVPVGRRGARVRPSPARRRRQPARPARRVVGRSGRYRCHR